MLTLLTFPIGWLTVLTAYCEGWMVGIVNDPKMMVGIDNDPNMVVGIIHDPKIMVGIVNDPKIMVDVTLTMTPR